jgi:hypothetical protein
MAAQSRAVYILAAKSRGKTPLHVPVVTEQWGSHLMILSCSSRPETPVTPPSLRGARVVMVANWNASQALFLTPLLLVAHMCCMQPSLGLGFNLTNGHNL